MLKKIESFAAWVERNQVVVAIAVVSLALVVRSVAEILRVAL